MSAAIDYERPTRGRRPPTLIVGLLLLVGAQVWLLADPKLVRDRGYLIACAAAIAAACVPTVRRGVERASRWLDRRGPWATAFRFAIASAAGGAILYATAVAGRRAFLPVVHDEFSYLLQARMIAEGHLWLPRHPLADFFDTFYVVTDRAYASQYFPGSALLIAPALFVGAPFWTATLAISAMACGAAFLVLRELFDGATAFVGVAIACGVVGFRFVSISAFAQPATMLWTALALWCVLRWDGTRRSRWLAAAGASLGAAAVTRPLDALVFAACCAALVGWRTRGAARAVWRRRLLLGCLPVVPFLALQLAVNHGVTGRWSQTPFGYYAARDMPGTDLGFHAYDAAARPLSQATEKQRFYVDRIRPYLAAHTPAGVWQAWTTKLLKNLVVELLPDVALIAVVPAALMTLGDPRRLFVVAALPLWVFAYLFHPFTYFHYYVVLILPAATLVFAGFDAVVRAVPRHRDVVRTATLLLALTVSVAAMPQFNRDVNDGVLDNRTEPRLRALAASIVEPRSIILIRDAPTASAEQAVLFNIDRAWPDDARTIRARDLGDRDVELYRYYAARQPDRAVYRFDRADDSFVRLGNVADLAAMATTRP